MFIKTQRPRYNHRIIILNLNVTRGGVTGGDNKAALKYLSYAVQDREPGKIIRVENKPTGQRPTDGKQEPLL